MRAFLSFNQSDLSTARALSRELRRQGVAVWFSEKNVTGGAFFAPEIDRAMRASSSLLLLASRHSVGNRKEEMKGSEHVGRELGLAFSQNKRVVPLALDASLPRQQVSDGFNYLLTNCQYLDLRNAVRTGDYVQACQDIVASLRGAPLANEQTNARQLAAAEKALALGKWTLALELPLGESGKENAHVRLLHTIGRLQQAGPLHRLSKERADAEVTELRDLCDTSERASALYLLGVLSWLYYQFNGIDDPTGGLCKLKGSNGSSPPVPARSLNAIGPLLPDRRFFELEWRRMG